MYLHVADYVVFGLTLLLSAAVGFYYYWKERTRNKKEDEIDAKHPMSDTANATESFFNANRNLKFLPTTASLFASFISAIALVGFPAEFYLYGPGLFMYCVGIALGALIASVCIVPVMYRLRLLSTFGYIQIRYGSLFLRRLGSISGIICTALYLAGVTLAPCVALEGVTNIPMWASVIVISTITTLYSVLGGMRAIVLVDLIQAILMFSGVIAAIALGFSKIDGGISKAWELAAEGGRLNFFDWNPDLRNTYSFYAVFFPSVLANIGLYGTSQGAVQRYSGLRTLRLAIWSEVLVMPLVMALAVVLLLLSVAMYAHYTLAGCDPIAGKLITSPNQLATYYITEIVGSTLPGFVGLWFAAIFSGSLSTMSTGYNSIAAMVWDDLLKDRMAKRSNAKLSPKHIHKLASMIAGASICVLAILFKYIPGSAIRLVVSTATVFECMMYIPYFCGLFMPWTNTKGVATGMIIAGCITTFISMGQLLGFGIESPPLPTDISNCPSSSIMLAVNSTTTSFPQNITLDLSTSMVPHNETSMGFFTYIFSISPFYLPLIELFFGCTIATIVSLLTGGVDRKSIISPKTIAPACAGLFKIDQGVDDVETIS